MKKYPPYSVLMSVYSKENPIFLRESIDSMLNQTVGPNEFVLVEDGPLTDELYEVIDNYVQKYPKVFKEIRLKKNVGLGPALRIGVNRCHNEWIARADSDDISFPDRMETQLIRIMKEPRIDIIGANHIEFIDSIYNKSSFLYKTLPSSNSQIKEYAKRRNPFSHSVLTIRKSKIVEAGNYRKCEYLEDYDLWVRMIKTGAYCENINNYLSYVRVSKDLYKRRGGLKYLKKIRAFKKNLYKSGFCSSRDYIVSVTIHSIICLIPNNMRNQFYKKILRK